MRIGISGAGGQLGRGVVEAVQRLAQGHDIVAISRQPDKLDAPVEKRTGDYDKPDMLALAYAGIDRLLIIPSPDLRPGVRSAQGLAAIDAALAAGVGHIFLLSATGTRLKTEPDVGAAYWASERRIVTSGVAAWTILRANYFSETFAEQSDMAVKTGHIAGLAENRVAFVSRQDVAEAAAAALATEGHAGAIYNFSGPDRISGVERAAMVAERTGHPVTFSIMTETQLREAMQGAQLPPFVIDAIISMQLAQASGHYDILTGDIEKLIGRPPRALRQVLADSGATASANSEVR